MRLLILTWLTRVLLVLIVVIVEPQTALADPGIIVGDDTAESCTESALQSALNVAGASGGGHIGFRCGRDPVTIAITDTLIPPTHTAINGGGLVSLEAPFFSSEVAVLIFVEQDSDVTLKNLSVLGGDIGIINLGTLTIRSSTLGDNFLRSVSNFGTLTVSSSTFCCQTTGFFGSGILNTGLLRVKDSTFTDNPDGHGIANIGTAFVKDSTFNNNSFRGGTGGAIDNGGSLLIKNSRFSENVSLHGGAIINSGTLTIRDSTLSKNLAILGGGVFNTGTLAIYTSIVTNNVATFGGGVYTCCGGTTILRDTPVTANTPDDIFP
jgi:hypothetical protein